MSKPFQANLEAKESSETIVLDIVRRKARIAFFSIFEFLRSNMKI